MALKKIALNDSLESDGAQEYVKTIWYELAMHTFRSKRNGLTRTSASQGQTKSVMPQSESKACLPELALLVPADTHGVHVL